MFAESRYGSSNGFILFLSPVVRVICVLMFLRDTRLAYLRFIPPTCALFAILRGTRGDIKREFLNGCSFNVYGVVYLRLSRTESMRKIREFDRFR